MLEQASAHQMCLTENYVVIMAATLVLDTGSLAEPLVQMKGWASRSGPRWRRRPAARACRAIAGCLRAAVPPSHTDLYFVAKADLRRALDAGDGKVEATRVRLDFEATHAVADHDDTGGRITLYCQHNIGADPADQLHRDRLLDGSPVDPGLEGMFSASTDLNQVRKHVVDAATGELLSTEAFPDPASPDGFAFGLNLLPPLQVLPYLPDRDAVRFNQQRCIRTWDCTFWVSGGWPSATSVQRVFAGHRRERRKRLVPDEEYRERVADVANVVRLFRLDRSLRVESAYFFEPGMVMGAPVFVPRTDAASVRDGYLVGSVWRHDDPAMEVWVWDSGGDLADGPLCVLAAAAGETGLRPGFPLHGCWVDHDGVASWQPPAYRVPAVEVGSGLKAAQVVAAGWTAVRRLVQQTITRR